MLKCIPRNKISAGKQKWVCCLVELFQSIALDGQSTLVRPSPPLPPPPLPPPSLPLFPPSPPPFPTLLLSPTSTLHRPPRTFHSELRCVSGSLRAYRHPGHCHTHIHIYPTPHQPARSNALILVASAPVPPPLTSITFAHSGCEPPGRHSRQTLPPRSL